MIDRHGHLVMSNKAMTQLLSHDQHELTQQHLSELMPEFWHLFEEDFALADMGEAIPGREIIWHDRCYDTQSVAVTDASSNVVGLSVTWVDITARRQAEQKLAGANQVLQRHAQPDHLTGLFNRRYMDECLLNEVSRSTEGKSPLSICLVDIDFFKLYNDSQGHLAGDECLKTVARALVASLIRSDDNVSRYGGEEFLVILPDTSKDAAQVVAERLREQVSILRQSRRL